MSGTPGLLGDLSGTPGAAISRGYTAPAISGVVTGVSSYFEDDHGHQYTFYGEATYDATYGRIRIYTYMPAEIPEGYDKLKVYIITDR